MNEWKKIQEEENEEKFHLQEPEKHHHMIYLILTRNRFALNDIVSFNQQK